MSTETPTQPKVKQPTYRIVNDRIVEDGGVGAPPAPATPAVPQYADIWALVENWGQNGVNGNSVSATENLQQALRAKDAEEARLRALLVRWERSAGTTLEEAEETSPACHLAKEGAAP